MASLRKFPHSRYWYGCFTMPDGKRVQRSTRETGRKEAQRIADQWETLTRERAKARQVQSVIRDIYKAAHGSELPDATPRAFITNWLTRRKGEIAPSSFAAYSGRATHFLEWLGAGADGALAELDVKTFITYRDALAAKVSATTANQGIKLLRVIFEDARREGFIAENPAKDAGTLRRSADTVSRRPFTVDELKAVLAVAGPEWRSMILFALYTGQRLRDIARLTWANIDLTAGEIHLRTGKTGRMVRIPVCGPLLRHIESLPAGDDPKASLHPVAASTGNVSTLSRRFGELMADAGLAVRRDHSAVKEGRSSRRALAELSFHSIRHSAVSLMKNAGVSPAVVQDVVGHESAEMSAHYTKIESAAKRQALDTLPDLL